MDAEIIRVYREHLPSLRFIGKRYTNADRIGGFAHKWSEWFEKGWFDALEAPGAPRDVEGGFIGLMRCDMKDFENSFEYWIGAFLPEGAEVPDGYAHIDLAASDVAVCWIRGREDGGIYAMHEACVAKFQENGLDKFWRDAEDRVYFFERYNCPRFTKPDEAGNVILDYGVYLGE